MYVGYNKRPKLKIKDSEGNEISSMNEVKMNHLKKNQDGSLDFRNLPPIVYYLEGNIFPTGHTETISVWGANFNAGTTIEIQGCFIENQFYINPFHIIIVLRTGQDVNIPVLTVDNGISVDFKNLLKIQNGQKIIYTENDFVLTNSYIDDTDIFKTNMSLVSEGTCSIHIEPEKNFDIYFRLLPTALEAGPTAQWNPSLIGLRAVNDHSRFHRVSQRVFNDGRVNNNDTRLELNGGNITHITNDFDVLCNFRRYDNKIQFNYDGIQQAEASDHILNDDIEFYFNLYRSRIVDLEIFTS